MTHVSAPIVRATKAHPVHRGRTRAAITRPGTIVSTDAHHRRISCKLWLFPRGDGSLGLGYGFFLAKRPRVKLGEDDAFNNKVTIALKPKRALSEVELDAYNLEIQSATIERRRPMVMTKSGQGFSRVSDRGPSTWCNKGLTQGGFLRSR